MDKNVAKSERLIRIAGVWDGDVVLSLLRAAPFRISNQTHLYFNPIIQASDVLCCPPGGVPKTVKELECRLSSDAVRQRKKALRRLTWDGAEYKLIYKWRTCQGDEIWIQEQGRRKSGTGDQAEEIEGVLTNVNGEQHRRTREAYLTNFDSLTGVANLENSKRALSHLAALSERQCGGGALLRLRISNIGDINDIYGFDTGDRVLSEYAKRLTRIIRAPDVLGRIGGADFALILYGATPQDVKAIAERLCFLLENSPVQTPHGDLYGEICMGATQFRTQARSAKEALFQSRTAVDRAKPSQLCFYNEGMETAANVVSREITEKDIIEALNQRRIQLAYQPIIHTKTARLYHYECLLRLRRKDGEVVSAGQVIMAAERLGLVHMLDRRALELASETLKQHPNVHLALNVSAGTVKDPETAGEYVSALKSLGTYADQITLELTETVALDDPTMASEFSNKVRGLGCSFAIDDFGSGYTTFRNLMAIEADAIKIDGTLIQGIASDQNKQTFVRMMVDLAQTFSVKTVAEMVDSRADADILRRLGVDFLQGFMFGVPSAAPSWQKRAS